jgi:hypothetical protein
LGENDMPAKLERATIRASPVTIRFRGGKKLGCSRLGDSGALFSEEKDDLVFRSSLGQGHTLTKHLKWMLGMVQHDSAEFKRARQEGLDIVLQIKSESADFCLEPEALLLPHKLHLPVEVSFRK